MLRAESARLFNQRRRAFGVQANLVELALVVRACVDIQHQVRVLHIVQYSPTDAFKGGAVRSARKRAVHVQLSGGRNHSGTAVKSQRIEHRIDIDNAVQMLRLCHDTAGNAKNDQLAHHFIAVDSRCDAQTAGGFSFGCITAALDAPCFRYRHGYAGNSRNLPDDRHTCSLAFKKEPAQGAAPSLFG